MRKAYLILAILIIAATAPAQLVMRHDGKTDNTLTQVPKYAVRFLDGGGWISRLDSADWHTRNRCGYYEAVRAVADPGMIITGRAWPDEPTDGVFREQITAQITQAEHDAAQAEAQEAALQEIRTAEAEKRAVRLSVEHLVLQDSLTVAQIIDLVDVFAAWEYPIAYPANSICRHAGTAYRCVQAHTSQADWTPDVVPALWTPYTPAGVVAPFVQPTGAHDAYQIGDRVSFDGGIWESTINANVWSPTAYPAGWTRIGDA